MKRKLSKPYIALFLLLPLLLAPASFAKTTARRAAARPAPVAPVVQGGNVNINGFFAANKAQRGRTIQAALVMDIPRGLHVNANRPLGKYSVPTRVTVSAPRGWKVSPVTYPRARVRNFQFGEGSPAERLAVYEGRAIMRFNVSVPANEQVGVKRLSVRVNYQSCTDTVCYPPTSRTVTLPIGVVDTDDPVQRINGNIFGGRGR